jgi:cytoskeleton protein RodZ
MLRACREKAGYDLGELSRQLRIRRAFLEAIETGRFADLPGPTYATGFVKAYADFFGLDAADIVRRFRNEAGEGNGTQPLHFPAPVAERGTPKAAVILIGLFIAAVAYGVWYTNTIHDDALVRFVAPVPERLRGLIKNEGEEAEFRPATATAAGAEKPAVVVPVPPRTATPSLPVGEGAGVPPPAPPASSPGSPPAPPTVSPGTTPEARVAAREAAAPSPKVAPGQVVLRAKADSWLQVRNPETRSVLFSRVLKAEESYVVPMQPGLLMTVGNAGGIEVLIDGETFPPLGRDGSVRRNVPLDAAALRQALAGGN